MRVFLTGGAGWIGSHLARLLTDRGEAVLALTRSLPIPPRAADLAGRVAWVEGDFCRPGAWQDAVRDFRPEIALHLAWIATPGRYLEAPENRECVRASLELLDLLHAAGCSRVAVAGTCFEYDASRGWLSEKSPPRPTSLYAACKHALFLIATQLQRARGGSLVWPRLFYQYGPHEDPRRLVPYVYRKLAAGEPCPLTAGTQVRDFSHVSDVVSGFWAAAASDLEGAVNLGSGVPVTVAEVARAVAREMGREELLRLGEQPIPPGDPPFLCSDNRLLRETTGWAPRYDLRAGIAETVAWWRSRPEGAADG